MDIFIRVTKNNSENQCSEVSECKFFFYGDTIVFWINGFIPLSCHIRDFLSLYFRLISVILSLKCYCFTWLKKQTHYWTLLKFVLVASYYSTFCRICVGHAVTVVQIISYNWLERIQWFYFRVWPSSKCIAYAIHCVIWYCTYSSALIDINVTKTN